MRPSVTSGSAGGRRSSSREGERRRKAAGRKLDLGLPPSEVLGRLAEADPELVVSELQSLADAPGRGVEPLGSVVRVLAQDAANAQRGLAGGPTGPAGLAVDLAELLLDRLASAGRQGCDARPSGAGLKARAIARTGSAR